MDYWMYKNSLAHFGILGQKWGVRRYQNKDGSLTPEGKTRYSGNNLRNDIDAQKEVSGVIQKVKRRDYSDIKAYNDIVDGMVNDLKGTSSIQKIAKENKNIMNDFTDRVNRLPESQKNDIVNKAADRIERYVDDIDPNYHLLYVADDVIGSSLYDAIPNEIKNTFNVSKFNDNSNKFKKSIENYTKKALSSVYDDSVDDDEYKTVGKSATEVVTNKLRWDDDLVNTRPIDLSSKEGQHSFIMRNYNMDLIDKLDDELHRRAIDMYD